MPAVNDDPGGLRELERLFLGDDGPSPRARAALASADRMCRELAEHIEAEIVHDLTTIGVALDLAAEQDLVSDDPRSPLTARRRSIQQCARLLSAVAEQLAPPGG